MASSSTVNVVRYTALATGVFYGWYHHRQLQAAHDQHKREHALHEREQLIAKAKDAWKAKQTAPVVNDGVISDPEDPRFDLEKLFAKWEAEHS